MRFGTRVYQILHGRIFEPYCGLRTMRPASGIWMKLHRKCGASVHLIVIYRRNTIIVCSNLRKRKRSYRKWNPWRRRMKRTSWSSSRIRWLQSFWAWLPTWILPNPGLKVQSSRICRNSLWRWVRAMLSSPGSSISLPTQGIISLTWYSTITF